MSPRILLPGAGFLRAPQAAPPVKSRDARRKKNARFGWKKERRDFMAYPHFMSRRLPEAENKNSHIIAAYLAENAHLLDFPWEICPNIIRICAILI